MTFTPSLKLALLAGTLLLLQACAYAPGSHIDSKGWFPKYESPPEEDFTDLVNVQRIGPDTLRQAVESRTPPPAEELIRDDDSYQYHVGIGDVLQVTVWDHPELTIPAGSNRSSEESGNVVNSDGSIYYPFVGYLQVRGMTTQEIRDIMAERLANYIESPQVDVTVAGFRSQRVYVAGAVEEPGVYPLTNVPTRLVDVISQARGLSENGDWRQVILTRDGQDYRLSLKDVFEKGNKQHNVLLQHDDVISVPRGDDQKVFVLGEVGAAQSLPMGRNGLSLAEALASVGGLNEQQSDATGVFVVRRAPMALEDDDPLIDLFQLNMKDATALVMADSFELQSRDIVYVTAAPLARWNRVISLLVPSFTQIFLMDRAVSTFE